MLYLHILHTELSVILCLFVQDAITVSAYFHSHQHRHAGIAHPAAAVKLVLVKPSLTKAFVISGHNFTSTLTGLCSPV